MPFPRHVVEPKYLCQGLRSNDEGKKATLHEYNNLTLTNFIRQLANLSGQVEFIFGSLMKESEDLFSRIKDIKVRLIDVEMKAKKLDSLKEDVGLGLKKDKKIVFKSIADRSQFFQSESRLDTGLFMAQDRSDEVRTLRGVAEAMPRLHDLQKYRTDNKQCAKIYSNPDLFFLAWQDSLQKMIAEQTLKSHIAARKTVRQTRLRRVRRAKASRIIDAQKYKMGAEFVPKEKSNKEDEEDVYFTDEEWSNSDEETENKMTNGNVKQMPGANNHQLKPDLDGVKNDLLPPPPTPPTTIPLPSTKMNGEESWREYDFNDIDFSLKEDVMPPPPISPDTLNLNGDLPPPLPPPDMDYSGRSADYNIQTALDSMSSIRWADDT